MAQCNNCNRTGKLVMQTVEPANQSAGMSTPWVFRFYLCRWHLAAWNRTRRPGHKKLVPVEYQSNDALLSAPPRRTAMYEQLAKSHPSLERGMVWCKTCGKSQRVDSADCLRNGWPKCCGYTMTIDHPSTWKENRDG